MVTDENSQAEVGSQLDFHPPFIPDFTTPQISTMMLA